MSRVLGVIPARLGSTRLPRKPLHSLAGAPLLAWVWHQVVNFPVFDRVVIATDADEIMELARRMGAAAVMTSPHHPSGTDRVFEACRGLGESFDVIVNVQGDEPLVDESHIAQAVSLVAEGWDVGTCATPIEHADEFHNPSVVKVVRSRKGGALYFSRAAIPHRRSDGPGGARSPAAVAPDRMERMVQALRHVGIYAYSRSALERWVALPPSPLEHIERLEQLRALEEGMRIGVAVVDAAAGGVDTPEDARRIENILIERGITAPSLVPSPTEQHGSA